MNLKVISNFGLVETAQMVSLSRVKRLRILSHCFQFPVVTEAHSLEAPVEKL